MSNRYRCPHCSAIFAKSDNVKAAQITAAMTGARIGGTDPICPQCNQRASFQSLVAGEYDLPDLPEPDVLDEMVAKMIQDLMMEGAVMSRGKCAADDLSRNAINRAGMNLHKQYGLGKAEVVEVIQRAMKKLSSD